MTAHQLDVTTATHDYRIHIEIDSLPTLGSAVGAVVPHAKAVVVVDTNVKDTHGKVAVASMQDAGYEVVTVELVAEETGKDLLAVKNIYDVLLDAQLERDSPIVAVGGGIVGDVAGFAASSWLRGVSFVQVPTTLLAMVDASVGGKTGVNFAGQTEQLYKNIIGAFWPPRLVLSDPQVLATLDQRDFCCGLAECIKHGIIASAEHFALIQDHADAILQRDMPRLQTLIYESVRIKKTIVEKDERERGRRALLNLGHTFSHAIESLASETYKHGEAVGIGLVAAAKCAQMTGRMDRPDAESIEQAIANVGLWTSLDGVSLDAVELCHVMQHDKKVRDGQLRLILPRSIGDCEIVDDVSENEVLAAWHAVGAR